MDKPFDVIIVGSGAGRGTLAKCLAPSGRHPHSRARRLAQTRSEKLEAAAVFEKIATSRPTPGTTATVGLFSRRSIISSAAQLTCSAPHSIASRTSFRRAAPSRRHLTSLANQLSGPRAVLRKSRGHVPRSRVAGARSRPSRPLADLIRALRRRRAADFAAPQQPDRGRYHPFAAPYPIMLNEANMAYARVSAVKLVTAFLCLVHANPTQKSWMCGQRSNFPT